MAGRTRVRIGPRLLAAAPPTFFRTLTSGTLSLEPPRALPPKLTSVPLSQPQPGSSQNDSWSARAAADNSWTPKGMVGVHIL